MSKLRTFIQNRKVLSCGFIFAILSFVGNALSILIMNNAHIYDIIHAIPTVIIYEPIVNKMGGYVSSEFLFVPLAVFIDFIIGIVLGFILKKTTKTEKSYLVSATILFLVYWIVITYQWLPII
ncbi:hypothetical protein [Clostridium ihumii]|uniref:hypothetical protein n=1 Tax=Clostridium ihumii TaxID=1470356 RepID=UPI00058C8AFC|nr:hypothetical protein [Clostridium ihumii]